MSLSDYQPIRATRFLHRLPRFGHSRSIASFVSSDSVEDYQGGIVAFFVFFVLILSTWTAVLLALKYYYRMERVGCAAGGQVVDVKEMKKKCNLDKFERKQRIKRNWRVQNTCLITCILLFPCTILMIKFGLDPLIESLYDVQQMNDRIDSHAYRGIQTVTQLHDAYNSIRRVQQQDFLWWDDNFTNLTVDVMCLGNITKMSSFMGTFSMVGIPSNRTNTSLPRRNVTIRMSDIFDWKSFQNEVNTTVTNVSTAYDFNASNLVLVPLTQGTAAVDTGIDSLKGHDWIIRLFVVILDVVVVFLIIGILFVKDNVDYPAYQSFTAYILIPLFGASMIATVVGTYIFSVIGVMNADFCAGGSSFGDHSPLGTMREVIAQYGYTPGTFPFRALQYYEDDCLGEDPFAGMKNIKSTVDTAYSHTLDIYEAASEILDKCVRGNKSGSTFNTNGTLHSIAQDLSNIDGSMTSIFDLTDCSSISPILRQLLFGSTCTESVKGLAALYSLLMLILLLGFIVLSTRAALYNPVIRGRRNKRREKEFDDYKVYMSEFYDTSNWNIDQIPEVCTNNSATDESDCNDIDIQDSETTCHNEMNRVESESVALSLVPAVSITEKSSSVKVGIKEETDAKTVADADDDDDSYDSTYSIDAEEEQSVTSISVFSTFMKRRVQSLYRNENNKSADFGGSQDEIISKMSSGSSMINRLRRRSGKLQSKTTLPIQPMNTVPHHPYDHRINSYEEDDDSVENDENDSNVGVLLTPPMLRHTANQNSSMAKSQQKQNVLLPAISSSDVDEMSSSPLALELQPLSPASIKSENVVRKPDQSYFRASKYPLKGATAGSRWNVFR